MVITFGPANVYLKHRASLVAIPVESYNSDSQVVMLWSQTIVSGLLLRVYMLFMHLWAALYLLIMLRKRLQKY